MTETSSSPYTPYDDLSASQAGSYGRTAAALGIAAMTLCMLGCCSSQLSVCVSIAPAGVALYLGNQARTSGDREARSLGTVGVVTSLISLGYFLLVLAVITIYVLLYVAIFGVAALSSL